MANFLTRWFKKEAAVKLDKPKDTDLRLISYEGSRYGVMNIGEFPRANPDDLARRKGLSIYAQMRMDEQVKAVCVFKRDVILSRGWSFMFPDDCKLSDKEKKDRITLFNKLVRKMPGTFIDVLNNVSTGREFGFSLSEKVYGIVTLDGKTWTGISKIKTRDPSSFDFITDDQGELIRCEQVIGNRRVEIPLEKFIFYVHNPEFDEYFGRSDLREAYRSWYFKNEMIKYWAIYMEKMGGGVWVGKTVEDTAPRAGTQAFDTLTQVLRNAKNSGSIMLPKGVDLDVIFPTSSDAYEKVCTWHDLAIARALLVPNLLGVSHTGQTGAYSQSQTQLEAFAWTIKADSERLAACLNDQLFKDLGDRNWGDEEYPEFCFNPVSQEQLRWMVTTWKDLVGAKAVITTEADEARLREILEMPPRDEKSVPLVDPNEEAQRQHELKVAEASAKAGPDDQEPSSKESDKEDTDSKKVTKADLRDAIAVAIGHQRHKEESVSMRRALRRASSRVSFAVIAARQDSLAKALIADLSTNVCRITANLLGNDEQLKLLIDTDVSDIASIEFSSADKGKIKTLFTRALTGAWSLGQQHALTELERANRKKLARVNMANLRDRAGEYLDANGFRMSGNVSDGARAVIQQELQNSVKFGRTPKQAREAIWSRLVSKGFSTREAVRGQETDEGVLQALNELWVDDENEAAHYLDTLTRTNLFEAMNEARFAEFTDPELSDFILALRYSSVLDNRTTEICEAMHNRVFKTDNPVWDDLRPPNHFNCRSVLVPITSVDGWDGEEDEVPNVEAQVGFGK